jgi:hypothetical protein
MVLRALRDLLSVPVCGDGVINQPTEARARNDLAGASCERGAAGQRAGAQA